MAQDVCSRCAELLPEIDGSGECPECGLGFSAGQLLQRLPASREKPLDDEQLRAWRQGLADQSVAAVAQAPFVPFGLDESWSGIRWVGGHSASQTSGGFGRRRKMVIHSIELAHGQRLLVDEPHVDVTTSLKSDSRNSLRHVLEDLLWHVWHLSLIHI